MINRIAIIVGIVIVLIAGGIFLSKRDSGEVVPSKGVDLQAQQLFDQSQTFIQDGEMLKAKEILQQLLTTYPDYQKIDVAQKELENLNMKIILSNLETPKTVMHEIKEGDTLGKIAKKYGTTMEFIKASNNMKSDVVRLGQKLRVWQGAFNIFVDKSQNILILKDGEEVLKVYSVSTGEKNSTPVGTFTITSRLENPVWFNRGIVVPPDSPENVLGTRWLGFDMPGYGIHGTVEPDNIGQQVTAGCVRMRNEEVEELYNIIPLGTKVTVVN